MFPANALSAPSVADVPMAQKTLHPEAPLTRIIAERAAVVMVLAPGIWKTQVALESPAPSSVRLPASVTLVLNAYTPASRVWPPSVGLVIMPPESARAASKADVASALPWTAAGDPVPVVPVNTPGGNPVIDAPLVPMSPSTIVKPVLVMPVTASAPKDAAVPRLIYRMCWNETS